MSDLNFLQQIILRCVPFRLNQFLQTKVWKNGVYTGGMSEEQRSIAMKTFFKSLPVCEPFKYGPPFEPPWLAFPDYQRYSMGFRMGPGEDYISQFRKWYFLSKTNIVIAFQLNYPETTEYSGFYNDFDEARKDYRKKEFG